MQTALFRAAIVAACIVMAGAPATRSQQDGIPAPSVDRVEYADPDKYLELLPSLGKSETIRKVAADITGRNDRAKLHAIHTWINEHLKYDAKAAYAWRDFDQMLADGTYGGCADHAVAFGALARACGIPTVWVKTMDAGWIRMYRRTRNENVPWSGHVFLEVHFDGRWVLLDASQGTVFTDYDTRQRIFPGDRFAYDKGGDPYALVLSPRWETWKEQTRRYFREFDLAQLPVPEGAPLQPSVFIASNNPEWDMIAKRCKESGLRVRYSGNNNFDEWLPKARGQILVVVYKAGKCVLPEQYRAAIPAQDLKAAMDKNSSGIVRHTSEGGTQVIVVFGGDSDELKAEIGNLKLTDD